MEKIKQLYILLDSMENAVHKLLEAAGAMLLAVSFISIFIQVSYRFIICRFMNLPLSFTEELSRFCLFWLVYLMLPVTIKQGLESANTFLPDRLKGTARLMLFLVVRGICLFVVLVAFRFTFNVLSTNWTYRSPAMRLPGVVMYLPVAIGMISVLFRYLIEAMGLIVRETEPFGIVRKGGAE